MSIYYTCPTIVSPPNRKRYATLSLIPSHPTHTSLLSRVRFSSITALNRKRVPPRSPIPVLPVLLMIPPTTHYLAYTFMSKQNIAEQFTLMRFHNLVEAYIHRVLSKDEHTHDTISDHATSSQAAVPQGPPISDITPPSLTPASSPVSSSTLFCTAPESLLTCFPVTQTPCLLW